MSFMNTKLTVKKNSVLLLLYMYFFIIPIWQIMILLLIRKPVVI